MKHTQLAKKIIDRADKDGLASDHPMRIAGQQFNHAAKGYFNEPQTVTVEKFLWCFAKARRLWCQYTGESLV